MEGIVVVALMSAKEGKVEEAIAGEVLAEPPRIVFSKPEPVGDPAKGRL